MKIGRKNSMKNVKSNNYGYSLAELTIVIAIMAILVGLLVTSVSILVGWDVKECAESIAGHLENVKTNALSKDGADLKIEKVDGKYIVQYVEYKMQDDGTGEPKIVPFDTNKYLLGKEKVSIVCYMDDGTNVTVSDVLNVSIGFNRASGALTEIKINDVVRLDLYCERIEISRGVIIYAIEMIPKTGKISVKRI